MPTFSIVVPTYNCAPLLPQCLDSIQGQSLIDWECIVVDDGSTDNTAAVVADYTCRDDRFRYCRQENRGVSAARNVGIERSVGEWVAFQDADDYYLPCALEMLAKAAHDAPDVSIVTGFVEPWVPISCGSGEVTTTDAFYAMVGVMNGEATPLRIQGAAVRRTLVDHIGGFPVGYVAAQDMDFWIRATAASQVATVQRAVAHYRTDNESSATVTHTASGRKIGFLRRILQDFISYPCVVERLRADPKRATVLRLRKAHLLVLDSVEFLRSGNTQAAGNTLVRAAEVCEDPEELGCLLNRLRSMLYFPRSRPGEAAERCASSMRAMASSLSWPEQGELRDKLLERASDTYFDAVAELSRAGARRQAWRVAFRGLRKERTMRSLKSAVRFAVARIH